MKDFSEHIDKLSSNKRELLDFLLDQVGIETTDWDRPYEAPRTPTEEMLAKIWAQVLRVDKVGIYDNFLELGGDSILGVQIIAKAGRVNLPFTAKQLFEFPSVAELATVVEANLRTSQGAQGPPMEPVARDGDLTLSFGQERLWFVNKLTPDSAANNAFTVVRLTGEFNIPAMERTFSEIRRRHEALRTVFPDVQGKPSQVIMPGVDVKLPVTDLTNIPIDQRQTHALRLCQQEAHRPFDLQHGPLVRFLLFKLKDNEYLLLLAMHHIVCDGWSLGVMMHEVMQLYSAFMEEKPSPLPELPIQYADFAHWQRRWLADEALRDQLAYWKEQLAGAPMLLNLPTDRPRPRVQNFQGAVDIFLINKSLTKSLKEFSRQNGVTLFMTLLAAFKMLLAYESGQQDIVVGTAISGRNRAETESLIGFFINSLALRTDIAGNPTFRVLLARVRDTTLKAYAHQDIPFEKLVSELRLARDPSYSPVFQVLFVLQNVPVPPIELPGVTASMIELERQSAELDLALSLEETQEGLKGWLEYGTELFNASTIARLRSNYQTLLGEVINHPDDRLADFFERLKEADELHKEQERLTREESNRKKLLETRPEPIVVRKKPQGRRSG